MTTGFTLVEITIAIGIFAFCIIALLGLLQVALQSSRESQNDSSIISILTTLDSQIRTMPIATLSRSAGTDLYFDLAGRPLTTPTDAFYKVQLKRVGDPSDYETVKDLFSLASGTNLGVWTASISYPEPAYTKTKNAVLGRLIW